MRVLRSNQFNAISPSKTPQGVIAVVSLPLEVHSANLSQPPGEKILLLEGIQNPGNVGTLIRTAAAFNFSGVIVSTESADPFSPKAVAASAGSIFSLWIRRLKEYALVVEDLKTNGYTIVAAGVHGTADTSLLKKKKVVLILGNEGKGLSQEMLDCADTVFTIPYNPHATESLNVAAAGAITMFLISQDVVLK